MLLSNSDGAAQTSVVARSQVVSGHDGTFICVLVALV